MNLETYIAQMRGQRGALENGFPSDPSTVPSAHNGWRFDERTTTRNLLPPGITFDDLSHLNPKKRGCEGGRPRKNK